MNFSRLLSLTVYFSILASGLNAQIPLLKTFEIQGDSNESPFVGQTVQLDTSVVVFARPDFAYVQSIKPDNNELTSEGLLINDGQLSSLAPGDLVLITGQVRETDGATNLAGSVSINEIGTAPLPPPVLLTAATEFTEVPPYERYEGMRVTFDLTIGQGSTDFNSVRVYPTENRPFREPGLEAPGISGLPQWDGNPELISYDPNGLGQANETFYNAGDQLQGIGIVEQFSFGYELSPTSSVTETLTEVVRPVRSKNGDELTIGSANVLFLLREESNYNLHLTKVVNYIQNSLQFPDVIALQEVGGQAEVDDLVFRLRQTDPNLGDYRGFSGTGTGSLKCAYLVNRRIENPQLEELGTDEFLSTGGILHDRPPFLLTFQVPGDETTELQILNLHLRSLNGISSASDFVRRKRKEQSVSVASMVQELRNENLIIVGDYNAFAFSDGYVDVVNQIAGTPSLGALLPVEDIVSPPLQILSQTLAAETEQYSFVFRGSAQQLDHCVANELDGLIIDELQYARGNADASVNFAFQAFSAPRASDHDAFVLYLDVEALSPTADAFFQDVNFKYANPSRAGSTIYYENLPAATRISFIDGWGRKQGTSRVQGFDDTASNGSLTIPDNLPSGMYWIQLENGGLIKAYPLVVDK